MFEKNVIRTQKLYALQGLRAFAAAMVIFVHALATFGNKVDATSLPTQFGGLGEMGVKLFFCISGFIIFTASKNFIPGIQSAAIFLKRRVIRVVPIYWLVTLVYATKLSLQGVPPSFYELGLSLLFIPYMNQWDLMRPVLGVGWSLNFEMFFYFLVGLSIFLKKEFRVLFLFLVLAALIFSRWLGFINHGTGFLSDVLYLLSDYYLIYFIGGLLIGVLRDFLKSNGVSYSLQFTPALLISGGFLGIYLFLHILGLIPSHMTEISMATVCMVCVLVSVFEFKPISHLTDGCIKRGLGLAGDASYSTYLTHGFVMGPLARIISYAEMPLSPLVFAFLMVPMCTFFGIFVYKFLEKPLLTFMNKKYS